MVERLNAYGSDTFEITASVGFPDASLCTALSNPGTVEPWRRLDLENLSAGKILKTMMRFGGHHRDSNRKDSSFDQSFWMVTSRKELVAMKRSK